MPDHDRFLDRDSSDTWDMPVKPPGSGGHPAGRSGNGQDSPAPAWNVPPEDPGWTASVRSPAFRERTQPPPPAVYRERPRPDQRRLSRPLIALAAVVIAAFVAGGVEAGNIRDHFATPHYVSASATAPVSGAGQPAANATDAWNNTWWGTGTPAPGATLDVGFGRPADLIDVAVTPGTGPTEREYRAQDSPRTMTITLVSQDGTSTTQTIQLPGSAGPRIFPVHADGVTRVHFAVTAVYRGSASASQVAIADIEFFTR